MKKFIICAAVVLAAGIMTSCNKDTNRCWEVTYKTTILGTETTVTAYMWGSQNELDAYVADIHALVGENVKVDTKRTSRAESECHE